MLNKKIKIIFDDGKEITRKVGICLSKDSDFLTLKTDYGTELIAIPKVIRIEVIDHD